MISWEYSSLDLSIFGDAGIEWPKAYWEDFYDCRKQIWYIEGTASPKDLIILVDYSGSMTGQRWQIARKTTDAILDSLTPNDFFNVFFVFFSFPYFSFCFLFSQSFIFLITNFTYKFENSTYFIILDLKSFTSFLSF